MAFCPLVTIAPPISLVPKIQHDVMQALTAVAETGSCVHSTNAQLSEWNKRQGERSKEGKGRSVKGCLKYSTSLPLTSRVGMGNTACTVHLMRESKRWCTMGVELFHPAALKSSSAFSQWRHLFFHSHFTLTLFTFFLTSICSPSPSFRGFLHLARTYWTPPHPSLLHRPPSLHLLFVCCITMLYSIQECLTTQLT